MGERGNAMATRVSSTARLVEVAANARGRNESWAVSLLDMALKPMFSAQAASEATEARFSEASR